VYIGVKSEHLTFIPYINKDGRQRNVACKANPMEVKNRRTAVNAEEKLDVISRLEKGERIVDIYRNVRLAHSSVRAMPVITGSAKTRTTVFV
jgi:hypothetical protein